MIQNLNSLQGEGEFLLEAQPLLHGDEAWYDARLTGVSGGRCVVRISGRCLAKY